MHLGHGHYKQPPPPGHARMCAGRGGWDGRIGGVAASGALFDSARKGSGQDSGKTGSDGGFVYALKISKFYKNFHHIKSSNTCIKY